MVVNNSDNNSDNPSTGRPNPTKQPPTPTRTSTATYTPTSAPTPTLTPTPTIVAAQNPFDTLYPANFILQSLSADPIPQIAKPNNKATGLSTVSYIDPVYGTRIYRITAVSDFPDAVFVRHEYSRRQAFNADNSRFIVTTSNGYWLLYDANTFQRLPRAGYNGALRGPAGDCEMIWHPTDPKKLWYMSGNGLIWLEKDVETDSKTVLVDFTGRLPWPQATISRDGSRIIFASNFNDGNSPDDYMIGLPSWVYGN